MNAKLVIADDEPDIRRLISFVLSQYTVLQAGNGRSALDLIRREQPDLVVLDMMMPEMNGIEVAQELARHPETAFIPVIFLSAKGRQVDIEQGLANGAASYIVKPFEADELLDKVAALLKAHVHTP